MEAFDTIWNQLATGGWCDGIGSEEYRRVKALWGHGAMTAALARFIARECNPGTSEGRAEALAMDVLYEAGGRANAEVERLKKERAEIVRTLRAMVDMWEVPDPNGDWGPPTDLLNKNLNEARELLRIIDAQKAT